MSESSERYFESLGGDWDRLRESFFSIRVRERAIDAAAVRRGGLAADIGAGTGFVTEGLVERGVRVIAIDRSPSMLDALRRKLAQVDCRVGEAESLPLDAASVDYCFANMFLHHVERPQAAIREMVRALRPGGRLIVTDLDAHDHDFLRHEHHDRWPGFARDSIASWFRDAGLEEVDVSCLGEDCCSTSASGQSAAIGIFVASGTKPGPS